MAYEALAVIASLVVIGVIAVTALVMGSLAYTKAQDAETTATTDSRLQPIVNFSTGSSTITDPLNGHAFFLGFGEFLEVSSSLPWGSTANFALVGGNTFLVSRNATITTFEVIADACIDLTGGPPPFDFTLTFQAFQTTPTTPTTHDGKSFIVANPSVDPAPFVALGSPQVLSFAATPDIHDYRAVASLTLNEAVIQGTNVGVYFSGATTGVLYTFLSFSARATFGFQF